MHHRMPASFAALRAPSRRDFLACRSKAARSFNDISSNNIALKTITREKVAIDAVMRLWSARDITANIDDHHFYEHPIIQAFALQLPSAEESEYKVTWSLVGKAFEGNIRRFQIVPYCGSRLLYGGSDLIMHRHPYSGNGSDNSLDDEFGGKFFSLCGSANFQSNGNILDVGLYGVGWSALNTFSNASVQASNIQITVRRIVT